MSTLTEFLDDLARSTGFSGVVRVDRPGAEPLSRAYGLADRRHGIAMTTDTVLATASGTKTFTALTVLSLVEDGLLDLGTTARSLLGDDLPLIAGDVTVEHLLGHRSGIGDYLDEEALESVADYVLTVPVHRLATAQDYLPVLDGFPTVFPAGERFSYCNGGYVVLALLAERAAGAGYHDLVTERVIARAGLRDTGFQRSDTPQPRTAVGYLEPAPGLRTNVLHLPLLGVGDGGVFTTVDDVHRLWAALDAGAVVAPATLAELVRPHGVDVAEDDRPPHRYGLGVWLHPTLDVVQLEGSDAGISFRSCHDAAAGLTWTVISNDSDGAWPVLRALAAELLG